MRWEDVSHRSLQPTFDTSTRKFRSIPEPATRAAMTASLMNIEREAQCHPDCGAGPPFADPTPGEAAFDDALQLRTGRPTSLLLFMSLMRKRRAPRAGRAFLARRFLPRGGSATRPLTLHFTPDAPLFRGSRRAPGPLPQPSRQRELLSRSEAPSIDKYPSARADGPSPSLWLCVPLAGSRRSFAPPFACA
jgi:hypothetical protein